MLTPPGKSSDKESDGESALFQIPRSYLEARTEFLECAAKVGGRLSSYLNPCSQGIEAEGLYCDLAEIGALDAEKVILISSGAHGVEGYCGSALQSHLLSELNAEPLPTNIRFVLVHALNPYGFSHSLRTTEDNVDLNRNFVDFSSLELNDPQYHNFRNQVFPDNWYGSDLERVLARVEQFIDQEGESAFQALMTKGQYSHPQDPYFGGLSPTWSNQIWSEICSTVLRGASTVVHIDLHSGLGEYGACEVIYTGPPTDVAIGEAKRIFGEHDVIPSGAENSVTPNISGPLINGVRQVHPDAIGIALEFGTVPISQMLRNVILATWLHHNPECDPAMRTDISKSVWRAFCSDDPAWINGIWRHTDRYVQRAMNGLKNV